MVENMIMILLLRNWQNSLKGEFECLGENAKKYISFSVPVKKEHNNGEIITYL